jgi:hypothetical protein
VRVPTLLLPLCTAYYIRDNLASRVAIRLRRLVEEPAIVLYSSILIIETHTRSDDGNQQLESCRPLPHGIIFIGINCLSRLTEFYLNFFV